jgi:protein-L-isoaspartate(D-aspartate) O-methyltransferase
MKKEELIRHLKNQKFPKKIIKAFEKVEREDFIPKKEKLSAYEDIPLPIGFGQTISQPYTIAFMLTLLNIKDRQIILEVGSGSGYVLALLSKLCPSGKIFGIERIKELAERSKKVLDKMKIKNIQTLNADGSRGLKKQAPFDRILVSASSNELPQNLINQLKVNGILVAPVRNSIVMVKKQSNENKITEYPGFVFVPLIED